jgi:hypothetical protein
MMLPTITVRAPWGEMIARLWKTLETRTHNRFAVLNHSWIAIHQGKTFDPIAYDVAGNWLSGAQRDILWSIVLGGAWSGGCVVAVAYVQEAGPIMDPQCDLDEYDAACWAALCHVDGLCGLWLRNVFPIAQARRRAGAAGHLAMGGDGRSYGVDRAAQRGGVGWR